MPKPDAEQWDARYSSATPPGSVTPPELVRTTFHDVPVGARMLDVACGWGDAGLWLAQRGASVTLTDVSSVALDAVDRRADALGVEAETVVADLTTTPVPIGPWDAISCVHYLDRDLLPRLADTLRPSGRLVVAIATMTNLERHERPSARFLLEPDELPTLFQRHHVIEHSEAWRENDAHEAWIVVGRAA